MNFHYLAIISSFLHYFIQFKISPTKINLKKMSLVQQKKHLEESFNPNTNTKLLNSDEEEEENIKRNEINKQFYYEWTKWMKPSQLDEFLDRFTCVRVPTGTFERCFLYYRRYPKDFGVFDPLKITEDSSLYQSNNTPKTDSKGFVNLNASQKDNSKINVKTFSNPYAIAKPDETK